ncbi:SH3 and multiple ankyrin repeat domains protein 3-like [Carassius auratus]|uniref:SH3 and multiple ankyrin repeat domains protein 3-like n=1 Tax=Carassius auratus TaxID=7957 RepID=A0A6P6JLG0_CARAU|nr:SH3 and multiple ankyrin repeat domains protein 3-like [Carassius auratus]
MTRPKFRPCPSCQTPNQASRKTCHVCFGSLSTKNKIKEKVASLDSQWGKSVLKSRNAGRIIDSARIAVLKLEAVGYKPILFIGKQDKRASNKWVADIITHLHPTPVTKVFLEKMRRAYEFILTKATSTAQQPESVPAERPESVPAERPESVPAERPESVPAERPESVPAERPESVAAERPESLTKQPETVFLLNLVPVPCSLSPTSLCPPSSATSTTVLPSLSSPLPPPLRQRKRR